MSDDPADCEYCGNGMQGSCPYWYQDPDTREWFHQKNFARKTVVENIERSKWGQIAKTPDGRQDPYNGQDRDRGGKGRDKGGKGGRDRRQRDYYDDSDNDDDGPSYFPRGGRHRR